MLIPVGLTRNIKPMQNPDRNPYLNSFLSNNHFVNVKNVKDKMQLTKNLSSNLFFDLL